MLSLVYTAQTLLNHVDVPPDMGKRDDDPISLSEKQFLLIGAC